MENLAKGRIIHMQRVRDSKQKEMGKLLNEIRVIDLKLDGYTNAEIAERLGVAEIVVEHILQVVKEGRA